MDARLLQGISYSNREVVATDVASLLTLVLSGPLLASVVIWYIAATFFWGVHVPKSIGIDVGQYTKEHYPYLYQRVNRALLKWAHLPPRSRPKDLVWDTWFTNVDGVTVPYQVFKRRILEL
ncbi:uncharacterized protein LOC108667872 isoform X2 [Hyalella azteca]|nr:uncharacterized protein LOC108667872 isoform X2 [Hyalella azteca]XP_047738134.1 uncharacterized protein LOC108667872 isoform X2 [Hyalella azteca]